MDAILDQGMQELEEAVPEEYQSERNTDELATFSYRISKKELGEYSVPRLGEREYDLELSKIHDRWGGVLEIDTFDQAYQTSRDHFLRPSESLDGLLQSQYRDFARVLNVPITGTAQPEDIKQIRAAQVLTIIKSYACRFQLQLLFTGVSDSVKSLNAKLQELEECHPRYIQMRLMAPVKEETKIERLKHLMLLLQCMRGKPLCRLALPVLCGAGFNLRTEKYALALLTQANQMTKQKSENLQQAAEAFAEMRKNNNALPASDTYAVASALSEAYNDREKKHVKHTLSNWAAEAKLTDEEKCKRLYCPDMDLIKKATGQIQSCFDEIVKFTDTLVRPRSPNADAIAAFEEKEFGKFRAVPLLHDSEWEGKGAIHTDNFFRSARETLQDVRTDSRPTKLPPFDPDGLIHTLAQTHAAEKITIALVWAPFPVLSNSLAESLDFNRPERPAVDRSHLGRRVGVAMQTTRAQRLFDYMDKNMPDHKDLFQLTNSHLTDTHTWLLDKKAPVGTESSLPFTPTTATMTPLPFAGPGGIEVEVEEYTYVALLGDSAFGKGDKKFDRALAKIATIMFGTSTKDSQKMALDVMRNRTLKVRSLVTGKERSRLLNQRAQQIQRFGVSAASGSSSSSSAAAASANSDSAAAAAPQEQPILPADPFSSLHNGYPDEPPFLTASAASAAAPQEQPSLPAEPFSLFQNADLGDIVWEDDVLPSGVTQEDDVLPGDQDVLEPGPHGDEKDNDKKRKSSSSRDSKSDKKAKGN